MRDETIDNIFNATPLTYWLYSGGRIRREDGGRWIGIPVMYAKNLTVQTLGPGGTININPPDHSSTAQFEWKFLAGSIMRLFADDSFNRGKNAIQNKVQNDIRNLELSIIDKFESMFFADGTGNAGKDFHGLQQLVSSTPTTGVVGGFDRATQTWWRNFQRTYSETGMITGDKGILFNMRKVYNSISIGNDHPTLIVTSQINYELYEASVTTLLQVTKTKLADAGFDALSYKGVALTFSPSAPATNMYFLNERYLELIINTFADFLMTNWKEIPNQLDRVAQVVVEGNLVTNNSRMQGVLTAIP
jgi:hypothetical protein